MSNFMIYLIGTIFVAAALGYGAYALGLAQTWIIVIVLIVVGFGIMGGVRNTRRKEKSDVD
jgi:hypothetical protein